MCLPSTIKTFLYIIFKCSPHLTPSTHTPRRILRKSSLLNMTSKNMDSMNNPEKSKEIMKNVIVSWVYGFLYLFEVFQVLLKFARELGRMLWINLPISKHHLTFANTSKPKYSSILENTITHRKGLSPISDLENSPFQDLQAPHVEGEPRTNRLINVRWYLPSPY